MKRIFILSLLILCSVIQLNAQKSAFEHVNPQIGSVHGRWFFYTPAALPFGMAKLAPHTNAYGSEGGWGPTGYDDRHGSIEGFGHFHEFQIGGLVFMPTVGDFKITPGSLEDPDSGYRSRFDKKDEKAQAGYYQVFLKDYGIKAELTATERVGFHRYAYPSSQEANLIIDIGHKQGESSDVVHASIKMVNGNQLVGSIETQPEYAKFCDPGKTVKMYFFIQLSKEPSLVKSFEGNQILDKSETQSVSNGLLLRFKMEEGEVLEIQSGLSYTSVENAKMNYELEAASMEFDEVKARSRQIWSEKLSRIEIEGGLDKDKTKFYTGLYHALLGRGLASDVKGTYPIVDGKIGQIPLDEKGLPRYHHYNTDGIWGGFWNLSQVWALAYPDYFSDYIQTNIDFYTHRGWLHDGMATGVFTNGVQTNFQGLLLASAYNVGIRDFDVEKGYEAALKNEVEYHGRDLGNGKYDLSYFVKDGYIPYKDTVISNGWVFNFGGSHSLEYSFSSFAVGQMAKSMGQEDDYQKLMKQAAYYKNLFDPETKFIRPKLEDGNFIQEFDPMKGWDGFQEGNAYQYTWYVPHDAQGLIDLIGLDLFNERLESMFDNAQKSMFGGGAEEIHSFSGVEKLYNHGNQPCLHNPWLFNYSGKPWLTQKWVRTICNEFYGTEPLHGYGVGQDEDQGQLGAWYVMASMGLFDVQGHAAIKPSFQFGSPLFDKITIILDPDYYSGETLVIKTKNQDVDHLYIQSATWNGQKIDKAWMYREDLMKGGELIFDLGAQPSQHWNNSELPPSMSKSKS